MSKTCRIFHHTPYKNQSWLNLKESRNLPGDAAQATPTRIFLSPCMYAYKSLGDLMIYKNSCLELNPIHILNSNKQFPSGQFCGPVINVFNLRCVRTCYQLTVKVSLTYIRSPSSRSQSELTLFSLTVRAPGVFDAGCSLNLY